MRILLAACVVGGGLAMTGGGAIAHHSFAVFDMSLPTEIEDTVQDFKFINPHTSLLLKAKDKDGRTMTWTLEGMSPSTLQRDGWTAKTLKPGDQVTLTILPVRGGGASGSWDPKWVRFRDGKAIAAGH